jgi:DNA-binding transcriptional regulator LsrR (DeoR family)
VSKLISLRGALAAGLATDVVLDEATARLLVDEQVETTAA